MSRTGASLMIAEVARLKALSEAQKEYIDNLEEARDAARAEIERLTHERDKALSAYDDMGITCCEIRDAAQAKTARLLEILSNLVCGACENRIGWNGGNAPMVHDWRRCAHCKPARAALSAAQSEKPGETGAMGKLDRRTAESTTSERSPVPTILGE